ANLADFGPAGPPKPLFELATGGGVNPMTGKPIPERVGSGWPRVPSAEAAVVVDGESGAILYGKNAHERIAPASLTKILTAIVAIEHGRPQDRVTVDVDSSTMYDSTVMGLAPGEVLSLETLLFGLMLPSGNDAALAIARHVGGSESRFMEMMNERVRTLGLQDSQFRNPHGLDEDGHYSTPYDLAMMARHGMQDSLFYHLSATKTWQGEGYTLNNLNRLLGQYPGADGVKVGFTDNAGRCLVASATRNGRRVFVTVLRSFDPAGDSRMLLDYAFQNFKW
ncbi:MAG: D-alanyl-D-alanine carboxypeptidase, partial [Chloroflexota bacterium]|nr:D-alanyl-D-alanine carboxypeptidase [Chloroflexota bacterium]